MKPTLPKHLMIIEFTMRMPRGYELNKVALFNDTVVSEAEVRKWIAEGVFEVENKATVVIMSRQQYLNLYDRIDDEDQKERVFYEDLAMEQKETM